MRALVETLARALVDDAAAVQVDEHQQGNAVCIRVHVAPGDVGRLIGKHGRTAQALRALLAATAARQGSRATLQIEEGIPRDASAPGRTRQSSRAAR